MKQVSLPEFIEFLSTQSASDFKGTSVNQFLAEHFVPQDDYLPFIYFREETYGRNLVYRSELFELLVITWLPQQRTPIHDHSGQRCWMTLQSGSLHFKNYKVGADGSELVVSGPVEVHSAGENVYIDDGLGVHSIANATSRPAISVHLYAGPIAACRIYNEKRRCFDTVQLAYFTCPSLLDSVLSTST